MCKNMIGGICVTRTIHVGNGEQIPITDVRKNDGRRLKPGERIYKGGGRYQTSSQRNREIDREEREKKRARARAAARKKKAKLAQPKPTETTPPVKVKPTIKVIKGVTPQQPTETPAQRRARIRAEKEARKAKRKPKQKPTATQTPGAPGGKKPRRRMCAVPGVPGGGKPKATSSGSGGGWGGPAVTAAGILLALGFLISFFNTYGAAIGAAILTAFTVLTWVLVLAFVVGAAVVVWSTRDADVWSVAGAKVKNTTRRVYGQVQQAKMNRARAREAIAEARAPIALGTTRPGAPDEVDLAEFTAQTLKACTNRRIDGGAESELEKVARTRKAG